MNEIYGSGEYRARLGRVTRNGIVVADCATHADAARIAEALNATPRGALTIAEDALREIVSPDCGYVDDAGDGCPAVDAGAPYRIAQGALERISAALDPGAVSDREECFACHGTGKFEPAADEDRPALPCAECDGTGWVKADPAPLEGAVEAERDDETERRLLDRLERDGLLKDGMTATDAWGFLNG